MRERKINLYEVGPRDWIICHKLEIDVEEIVRTISMTANAGVKRIEIGASLNYEKYPNLRNTYSILLELKKLRSQGKIPKDTIFSIYVGPSIKNYPKNKVRRMLESPLLEEKVMPDEISVSISASEERNEEIYGMSGNKVFDHIKRQIEMAKSDGIKVRGYVSATFGYKNYDDVPIGSAIGWTELLFDLGCYEVALGDTRGMAVRGKRKAFMKKWKAMKPHLNLERMSLHFHEHNYVDWETDILSILGDGLSTFDTSVFDIPEPRGGYEHEAQTIDKNIPPNASTEKMARFFEQINGEGYKILKRELGLDEDLIFVSGIDINKIMNAGQYIRGIIEKQKYSG